MVMVRAQEPLCCANLTEFVKEHLEKHGGVGALVGVAV